MTHPVQAAAAVTGQPVARVDGRQKVTGAARYAADNPVADVLYAALVCSTVARGNVELVDGSAAVKDQDVVRVIDSFGGVALPFDPGEVAFFGQPVAVVVAKTLEAATHGASQVTALQRRGSGQRYRLAAGQAAAQTAPDGLHPRRSRRCSAHGRRCVGHSVFDRPLQPQFDGVAVDHCALGG